MIPRLLALLVSLVAVVTAGAQTTTTTLPTPPTVPANLKVCAQNPAPSCTAPKNVVYWDASTAGTGGIGGYDIFRWDGSCFHPYGYVSAPSTQFVDTAPNIRCGTTYYYGVRSVARAGDGTNGVISPCLGSDATDFVVATTNVAGVSSQGDAAGNHPEWCPPPTIQTTTTTRLATTTTTSTTTTTTSGNPTTTTTLPADVTGFAASPDTLCTQERLAWDAEPNGQNLYGFDITRCTGSCTPSVVVRTVTPGTAVQATDTGLTGGQAYTWGIKAKATSSGPYSAHQMTVTGTPNICTTTTTLTTTTTKICTTTTTVTTTTTAGATTTTTAAQPPPAPTNLTATAAACNEVDLRWTLSTGTVSGYTVYRKVTGAPTYTLIQNLTASPTFPVRDFGAVASTNYTYAVQAYNGAGPSAQATAAVTTPACVTPPTLALTGMVPGVGQADDIVVDAVRHRAYMASEQFGLSIVDITTPAQAQTIGAIYGSSPKMLRVAVAGNRAVLGGNDQGFRVVDMSTETRPQIVGSLPDNTRELAIHPAGRYVYALVNVSNNPGHTDLVVIDLVTPSAPAIIQRTTQVGASTGLAPGVAVAGTSPAYLYVTAAGGLQVYSLAAPSTPSLVGQTNLPNGGGLVTVANGYAYVAAGSALQIVDVSTPSNPQLVGTPLAITVTQAVAASSTRLYAVDGSTLRVVDITTPSNPVVLGASLTNNYGARAIGALGNYALEASYAVDSNNRSGLFIVDVTTPTSPVLVRNVYGGYETSGVSVAGSLAAVAGFNLGMRILDISAPMTPAIVSSLTGNWKRVSIAGHFAYCSLGISGNPPHDDLAVVDLSTGSLTTPPTIVYRQSFAFVADVRVVGSTLYMANENGLQTFDVSTPSAPIPLGTAPLPYQGGRLAIVGSYAYLAASNALEPVNISDPRNMVVAPPITVTAVEVAGTGTRLYTVDGSTFRIYDLTNPAAPVLLSSKAVASVQGLAVIGNTVALASPGLSHTDLTGGIYNYDVTNGYNPIRVQQLIVPGLTRTVTADGGKFYAGDNASTLDVISVVP